MEQSKPLPDMLKEIYKAGLGLLEAQKLVEERLRPVGSPFVVVSLTDALKIIETNGKAIVEATTVLRKAAEAKADADDKGIRDLFDEMQNSFNLN